MSETEAETVADVLAAVDDPSTWKLEEVADPVIDDLPDMTYEDWVHPMKVTGGRVCLEFEFDYVGGTAWACRQASGHLAVRQDNWEDAEVPAMGYVEYCLERDSVHVTPVLREDTPFGEAEDA